MNWEKSKIGIVVLIALALNIFTVVIIGLDAIALNIRVEELESRVATVEDDQTNIVNGMKKTVELMKDIVTMKMGGK